MARPFLVLITMLLVLAVTTLRMSTSWHNDSNLDHVAGIWMTLASDLNEGTLYRPLYEARGYGGTRYFPLQFVLHAGLMRLGGDPRISGYALSFLATVLLLAGVYVLLRKLAVSTWLALSATASVLAANSAQHALLTIRGDMLPAALNVWAVALCAGPAPGMGAIAMAALLFTLAFSAKFSAVFGVAAVFLYLLLSDRPRYAWTLLVLCACGFLTALGVIDVASDGRFFEVLRACASADTTWSSLPLGPLHVLGMMRWHDPASLAYFVLGAAAIIASPSRFWLKLPPLLFLTTGTMMVLIFISPGTNFNHLLDLHVAAIVVFAVWLSRAAPETAAFGAAALAAATLVAVSAQLSNLRYQDQAPHRAEFQQTIRIIGNMKQPILAENPLIPLLAGQRPYLLDPFMFRILWQRDRSFAEPLWKKMRQKAFSAIVLRDDPSTAQGRKWYTEAHFGAQFVEELNQDYELRNRIGEQYIFRPRPSRTASGEATATHGVAPLDSPAR